MKKAMILLCGLLLVSGAYAAGSQMNFGVNFGIMTDDSFSFNPLLWTAGAELDFQFGEFLMFSPEVTLVGKGFEFESFWLYPAALVNFTPGNLFVGGGLTKGFLIGDSVPSVSTDVALKLNAGLISKNIKITAYLITAFDNLFDYMLVGASIGFRL